MRSSSTAQSAGSGNTYSPSTQPLPALVNVWVTCTRTTLPVTVACMRVCWRSAAAGAASGADFSHRVPARSACAASAGDQTMPRASSAASASQLASSCHRDALPPGA